MYFGDQKCTCGTAAGVPDVRDFGFAHGGVEVPPAVDALKSEDKGTPAVETLGMRDNNRLISKLSPAGRHKFYAWEKINKGIQKGEVHAVAMDPDGP